MARSDDWRSQRSDSDPGDDAEPHGASRPVWGLPDYVPSRPIEISDRTARQPDLVITPPSSRPPTSLVRVQHPDYTRRHEGQYGLSTAILFLLAASLFAGGLLGLLMVR